MIRVGAWQGGRRTLRTSRFLALYDSAAVGPLPALQHELFAALHAFLLLCARFYALADAAAASAFERMQRGALAERAGVEEALGDVPRLAQRLWTSDEPLVGEGPGGAPAARELCALLNAALRADDEALLRAALPLIRAINSLCVVRGARPERLVRLPPEHRCYRGGGLPDAHRAFFAAGVKYRVPGFLATSFQEQVPKATPRPKHAAPFAPGRPASTQSAPPPSSPRLCFPLHLLGLALPPHTPPPTPPWPPALPRLCLTARAISAGARERPAPGACRGRPATSVAAAAMARQVAARFGYRAFEEGLPSVLWVIQLDPRGASDVVHRCKQARGAGSPSGGGEERRV